MAEPAALYFPDLVLYAVMVLAPVVLLWMALAVPRLAGRIAQRLHQPEVIAHGPPIEQLAADLRRVHRVLQHEAPVTPIVRWRATRQAYDTLLAQACAAVEVSHRLDELPDGF